MGKKEMNDSNDRKLDADMKNNIMNGGSVEQKKKDVEPMAASKKIKAKKSKAKEQNDANVGKLDSDMKTNMMNDRSVEQKKDIEPMSANKKKKSKKNRKREM